MTLFADTGYWIALINPDDDLHHAAIQCAKDYEKRRIITTDAVLGEMLNEFSKWGELWRRKSVQLARKLQANPNVSIVRSTQENFWIAVDLYVERLDKAYSHTDCLSFHVMRLHNLNEALAHDKHFVQEGFKALLRSPNESIG